MTIETVDLAGMAEILKRSKRSVASDASKNPHKLPPRLRLPGSRKVLWLKTDVEKWLNAWRTAKSA